MLESRGVQVWRKLINFLFDIFWDIEILFDRTTLVVLCLIWTSWYWTNVRARDWTKTQFFFVPKNSNFVSHETTVQQLSVLQYNYMSTQKFQNTLSLSTKTHCLFFFLTNHTRYLSLSPSTMTYSFFWQIIHIVYWFIFKYIN